MEHNEPDCVAAFDTLYTTNHIQILKVLLSHMPPEQRGQLAVMIKYLELQHTLALVRDNTYKGPDLHSCDSPEHKFDLPGFLDEIQIYCTESERQKISQISGAFRAMEMYRQMQGLMDAVPGFADMFGEAFQPGNFTAAQEKNAENDAAKKEGRTGEPSGEQSDNSDGANDGDNGFDMSSLLKNILSPEQQAMFEMFQSGQKL